jgi:hypothetical protein
MRLIWTDEELDILKKHYATYNMDELLKMLPRFTLEKIRIKASQLGIKRVVKVVRKENAKMVRWNDEETELLKSVYSHSTNEELLGLFPRFDLRRIGYKARNLGLEKLEDIKEKDKEEQISKMLGDTEWTNDEVEILLENYETMGGKGLTKLLPNRTKLSITSKASKMGLSTEREAIWVNTDIKFSSEDVFSIQVTFERIDR